MMADGGMMMSGWFMALCIALGVLLLVALVLGVMALIKVPLLQEQVSRRVVMAVIGPTWARRSVA